MRRIDSESAIFFANQLRSARLEALADAEAFDEIVHAVERLGSYLDGKLSDLGSYKRMLTGLVESSWLAEPGEAFRNHLTPFSELYELVRIARNDALHQGAAARHLTKHAVELAIILEDALSSQLNPIVGAFMVRNPTCAEIWQPVGFIRQQMLANSYSYLPVFGVEGVWHVISDTSVARFLGPERDGSARKANLAMTLIDAYGQKPEILEPAVRLEPNANLNEALELLKQKNVILVMQTLQKDRATREDLLGIVTAFDLL